ncbi:hypothetical protein EYC80_002166 [Monilinia laxa]|uniref:Uncharacterized protein n=1 Tax=Monilinia laxa TaxID=61186 RepID=A0A5N6K399_MONLA|nr:hypothetical protein EYC80_002166 [Monilinia laxa]
MSGQDSPLSITSSVAGLLTFVAAIAAAIYVRFTYLRNANNEYFQVKASLSWHKTESQWLHDLYQITEDDQGRKWALVPKSMAFRTSVAMSWLPVRTKALDLVRQRDALGARVLFAQMSMMSSRVRDQEAQTRKQQKLDYERLDRLDSSFPTREV